MDDGKDESTSENTPAPLEEVVEPAEGGEDAPEPQREPVRSEADVARGEARENYDKFLRAAAELENFKRRAARERADIIKYAGESMARDLLDVLDNLERALLAASGSKGEDFVNGVRLIADQFKATFDRHGVRGESGLGSLFDPVKQEALASVPMPDKEPGTVLEEDPERRYFFKDKMLRPGQVVVAAKPPEVAAPSDPQTPKAGETGEGERGDEPIVSSD